MGAPRGLGGSGGPLSGGRDLRVREAMGDGGTLGLGNRRTGSEGPERGNSTLHVRVVGTVGPGQGAAQVLEGGGPGGEGGREGLAR